MSEPIRARLNELRAEFESGQKMLAELETRQAGLRDSLLRISGAIQVLEELLVSEAAAQSQPAGRENGR